MEHSIQDEELIALRDWIHFYEVLARFSLVHWIGEPYRQAICFEGSKSKLIQAGMNGSSQVIMRLIDCNATADAHNSIITQ